MPPLSIVGSSPLHRLGMRSVVAGPEEPVGDRLVLHAYAFVVRNLLGCDRVVRRVHHESRGAGDDFPLASALARRPEDGW